MKSKEIVKDLMGKAGVTNAVMADRLGLSQAAMWDRLNNTKAKDLSVSVLVDMLRALDYKVIIAPRSSRTPADGYEVGE